jgi:undecaprenyl pyrophosphate phosphatase UppP
MQNNNSADLATMLSIFSAVVSISNIQPVVTLIGSLVAIISGLFAIRYYYKVTKKLDQ